jgi:capsid protein
MLQMLLDTYRVIRLKARYQRLIHERLLSLTEQSVPAPVAEDPGNWQLLGGTSLTEPQRADLRRRARRLVQSNPHAQNILRILQSYVTGPGLQLTITSNSDHPEGELIAQLERCWHSFLQFNERHYSFTEHARRTWRDGECFIRLFRQVHGLPTIRFIDPEAIAPTAAAPDSQGILTAPDDVETPLHYLRCSPVSGELQEMIPADEVLHTRINADSNEKRGTTILAAVLDTLECFDQWLETELHARKLQSSIVLWRKVQGSPQVSTALADAASGNGTAGTRRERFQPGTILTTNHGTEIQFLQPRTNFGDAVPLGRMLLLSIAAGAGLPEFMLTSDASNANYASTMVAEGPAVKLFQSEQQFFAREFARLWRWVMQDAIERQHLPPDALDRVELQWHFPEVISRDRPAERTTDVRLVAAGILSRSEVARREGVDPQRMQRERAVESGSGPEDSRPPL